MSIPSVFSKSVVVNALAGVLWLVMMSVTLIESDAYRYAALSLIVLFVFFAPRSTNVLSRDWLVVLCVVCGGIALLRFLMQLALTGEKGASEWLYSFPLLFPLLGLALYGSWTVLRFVFASFFVVALLFLLIFTDFTHALTGDRIFPLLHHNPIHGAVACGFLVIGAFYWALYHYEMGSTRTTRAFVTVIASAVIAVALFNIWGSKSKGVWFSLVPTFLVLVPTVLFFLRRKEVVVTIALGALVVGSGLYFVRQNIFEVAGPTANSIVTVVSELASDRTVSSIFEEAIASPSTPVSFDERLQLWSNASEVIAVAPVLGSGNHWLTIWYATRYAGIPYTLMHNGYLEVLVRHGFVGLSIYGLIFIACVYRVFQASRLCIISKSAFSCYLVCAVYFAFTILSNSNNRLALGESYALLFSAVCFACTIKMTDSRLADSAPQPDASSDLGAGDRQRQTLA